MKKETIHIILTILGIILFIALLLFIFIFLTEYNPRDVENIDVINNNDNKVNKNDTLSIMTYNIGFASLDEKQDFFLDGGKTNGNLDKNLQLNNMNGIIDIMKNNKSDIYLFQEIDLNSTRTHNINQIELLRNSDASLSSSFAYFHKVLWIPYPVFNMMGHVESGLATLNKYNSINTRISLSSPYKLPISSFMFKRPLIKTIIPIEGFDKNLVVFNLHLEAYDTDGTRVKQLNKLLYEMQVEYDNGNYVIAGGDFNQKFPNLDNSKYPILNESHFVANTIEKDFLNNDFKYANDDTFATSRLLNKPYNINDKDTQLYVIDGFIVSNNIKVESVKVIDTKFKYSDHNPVRLEFKLIDKNKK